MLILYITYVDIGAAATSGSSVRPQKMYRAFSDAGYEVKLLSGSQERKNKEKRLAAVREIDTWLDTNIPDACYIESPVYPILLREDRRLIRRLHGMGVPIGYFYRDYYRKFPQLYAKRRDIIGYMKESYLDLMQRRTDRLLGKADIVYFPSVGAAELFDYHDMRALPPAGEDHLPAVTASGNTSIYVGGIAGDYGGEQMLEAFRELNEAGGRYPLLLVCRENEWAEYAPHWEKEPWLEVHHASGDALPPLYARAALALMPMEINEYNHFSVNVKLFEYMSYGLPVASTAVREIARLIRENGIGRADAVDAHSFAEEIKGMFSDPGAMEKYRGNCRTALLERHLWVHRAEQVVRDLKGKTP